MNEKLVIAFAINKKQIYSPGFSDILWFYCMLSAVKMRVDYTTSLVGGALQQQNRTTAV